MNSKSLLLAATACATLIPIAASAQQSTLGEVIVTARKRQESILNVPVVETAIAQQALERRQTTDLKDVARLVPGLSLAQANGALGTQVSLRGVGTSAINAGIDASVALNVDGLQITQSVAYASALFDVGQVEVLKGPQNLFYGKNSPGGVIALRTADPTDKVEVVARYGHEFEANEDRAELILSGPVTDSLRLRLATLYDTQDGYFNNVAVGLPQTGSLTPRDDKAPHDKNYVIRGTAIWRPIDQFDARLKINLTHDKMTGGDAQEVVSCPDGPAAVSSIGVPFLGGGDNCVRDRNLSFPDFNPAAFPGVLNGGVPFHETDQKYGSLELNYRPRPDLTVTSTTGIYDMEFLSTGSGCSCTYGGPSFLSIAEPLSRRDWTQELRANSDFAGPLNFTAGLYYQNGKILNRINLPGDVLLRLPVSIGHYEEFVQINSESVFGQVRWKVIPSVEVALGGRWTHEKRELTAKNLISGTPVLFPTAVPVIEPDNFAPELTITYKPTADVTVFGSLKKGFKSGMFNLTALTTANPDLSFGDEKVRGGEVGVKSRWLDRRLAADVAFYDYHYDGLQVGAVFPTVNVPVNRTLNAGSALIYGIDFDVSYLPPIVDNLTLRGAVEWNHARFKSLDNIPCWGGQTVAAGCNRIRNPATGLFTAQDLAGFPLVRAPDWQANFGFDWEAPIGNDMALIVSNTNQFSSRYLVNLGRRDDFFQSKFLKTDLTLTLRGPRDRWEFSLIGKNLGDVLSSSNCSNANIQNGALFQGEVTGGAGRGPAGVDELLCYMDRGREVWLRLTLKPFG